MVNLKDVISKLQSDGEIFIRSGESYSFGTLSECKDMLRETMILVDRTMKSFVWLEPYNEIAEWLSDTKGKGLLIRGSCGTGKTTILLSLIVIFNAYKHKVIHFTPARDMPNNNSIIKHWAYCLDDVGTEVMKNDYGEKIDVFQNIVDEADLKIKLLLISTNMNAKDMAARYGQRTIDRICRLCKIVKFENAEETSTYAGKIIKMVKEIRSMRK